MTTDRMSEAERAMIKLEVRNRFTGSVQFTAEIECANDAPPSIKLGLAVRWALQSRANLSGANLYGADLSGANLYGADLSGANLYGANLYGANLSGANLYGADLYGADLSRADLSRANLSRANLSRANLSGANLSGANLYGADLSGANLYGANLSGANLSGANLSGADLSGANLYGGVHRSDGYQFWLVNDRESGPCVRAGCRYFTLPEARKHWQRARGGTPLGKETMAILDFFERMAALKGWTAPAQQPVAA